jgi:hypothetical protein
LTNTRPPRKTSESGVLAVDEALARVVQTLDLGEVALVENDSCKGPPSAASWETEFMTQ